MPGWGREEEEEEEAEEEEEGERTFNMSRGPANKYQHFLNDLQSLISCATDSDIYEQLFLCGVTPMSIKSVNVTGSALKNRPLMFHLYSFNSRKKKTILFICLKPFSISTGS